MSADKSTLEDKILGIALLASFFGVGYLVRSELIFALFLSDFGLPSPVVIADGLIRIITLSLLLFVLLGMILLHFSKTDEPIKMAVSSDKTFEEAHQDAVDRVKERSKE